MSTQPDAPQELAFGLFDWIDAAPGRTAGEVYEDRLRLLTEADRGGFAVFPLAEHHGTPLGLAPSPAVFLAAAARETTRIRLAPTTFIVPLYDPLRLVEERGMLDQLSGGRLESGVVKRSSPHEARMFGLTPPQTAERFEELMPAILEAMETGVFRRPGADGETITLHAPTRRRPPPPLWYPTSNPASTPRLGDEGYNVIFGFGFVSPPLDVVREQSKLFFERYRASAERGTVRYGLPGTTPRFGLMRHVLVAPTDEDALDLLRPAFADHHTNFTHLWRLHGDEARSRPVDVDQLLDSGRLYAGSPETAARQVTEAVP